MMGRSIEDRLAAAGLPPLPRTAWAEIDLDALAGNLTILRELAGPGTPVHPVVKADAYGHGAVPVARALAAAGADGFCVASIDEAIALRQAGIEVPILVLYPIPPAYAAGAARDGIAVTAGDPALLQGLLGALVADPPDRTLDVHIEVETGLGRGGFSGAALRQAAHLIHIGERTRLAGAWTHLQAAEDALRTARQVEAFEAETRQLASEIGPLPTHLAASGGLLLDGVVSLNGVRPGLATYGLVPDELLRPGAQQLAAAAAGLRPVLSLHARPVRVADLPAGTGISYGPTFTTARASRIATLPLGYGDGWSRALSNRSVAIVRGTRVPLVGNVAMDAVMADVTDMTPPWVGVDDEFVLLGAQGTEQITAAEVAAVRGTNSWEVVTSLAARLPRVYHAASVPREIRTLVVDEVDARRSKRP